MKIQLKQLVGLSLIVGTSIYATQPGRTEPTPKRALLALSKGNHTLSIVDPDTLKVIAKAPVGPDPHEVVASDDGLTAYVSNTGSGRFHELNVIDLVAQKALPNFDTGALIGPHGLAFAAGKVWFTAEGAKAIARLDPKTSSIDWILGTGQNRTHMLQITPDEKQIYTANVASGTISICEDTLVPPTITPMGTTMPGAKPHQEWLQTVIPGGDGNEGFDVTPDGKQLWTAAAQDGTIVIIDIATKKAIDKLDAKVFGANRLKFTQDGKLALISSLRSGDLFIYDTATKKEIKRINLGHGAAGILIDKDRAFIGCTADDYVAVVDLKKLEVTGHIDVGGKPDGLTWAVRP